MKFPKKINRLALPTQSQPYQAHLVESEGNAAAILGLIYYPTLLITEIDDP